MITGSVRLVFDHLGPISFAAQARVAAVQMATGLAIEESWKADVPVDTGALRASINTQRRGADVFVGTDIEYAPFVEYGTSRMPARPSMRQAAEKHRAGYHAAAAAAIRGAA